MKPSQNLYQELLTIRSAEESLCYLYSISVDSQACLLIRTCFMCSRL